MSLGTPGRRRGVLAAAAAATLLLAAPAAAPADHGGVHLPTTELLPPSPAVPNQVQPGPSPLCRVPRHDCVRRVIRAMNRRWRPLDRSCDHRAVFALTYLRTTERFFATLRRDPGYFRGRRWVIHEDVGFARLYFRAYDGYEKRRAIPEAWQIAFDAATGRRTNRGQTNAGQDLFLGMNAHIQRDLPYVLASVGLRAQSGVSRKPDHDKVNRILTQVLDPVQDEVARRYDPFIAQTDMKPLPFEEYTALELLKSWREGAWRNAERLLTARTPAERAQVAQSIEISARAWAQAFAAGEQPGYGATRDGHCRAAHS